MTHIERVTGALVLASWWVIRGHFDSLAHCIEISICAAKALKTYKIKASAVPCAFLAVDNDNEVSFACGHSAQSLWNMMTAEQRAGMSYDAWLTEHVNIDMDIPVHAAIDATHAGHRIFVDLTVGQIRKLSKTPINVPDYIRYHDKGWPSVRLDSGVGLRYDPSPNEVEARRLIASAPPNKGIVEDFEDVMRVALACDLDRSQFTDKMIAVARSFGYLETIVSNHASIVGAEVPPAVMEGL